MNENEKRCVIISGAPDPDVDFIRETVRAEDHVICADSGYAAAKAAGIKPDLIVGDFDSYTGELPPDCEIVALLPEKDDTDTMHCVKLALERGFCSFVFLAATGGRLDHTLGDLCILEYLSERGGSGIILSRNEKIMFLAPGSYSFDGVKGQTFSVFPFGCESAVVTYRGAKYPMEHGALIHSAAVGVSNVFTTDNAEIAVHEGKTLVIVIARCASTLNKKGKA